MVNKLTIETMQQLANSRGGKCLSTTYVNAHSNLLWRCAKGHQWQATPNKIQQGRWCRKCGGTTKLTIHEMQILAKSRGGKCLSNVYINNQTNLLWECEEGHRWEATAANIKRGKWCPQCGGSKKLTIHEMQHLAKSRGGKCLSGVYINNQTPLIWECEKGHRWKAIPNSIKRGTWCRKCAGLEKHTLHEMEKIATERGGKCLSQIYQRAKAKLLWECKEGHQWEASHDKINRGQWCPICSSGLGERICREYFEQLFDDKFNKSRPKWLVNEDGNQMELDGFNRELGIAFEHQGEQHYSTKTHFIRKKAKLEKRKKDDKTKYNLCLKHNIKLIFIPEIPNRLLIDSVKEFIKEQCKRKNIPLPSGFSTKIVNLINAYSTCASKEIMNDLNNIASKRGGKCLSEVYISDNTKLLWECKEGHKWESVPSSIKQNTWCPYCAGVVKGSIEEMQILATKKGGKCISKKYNNSNSKLTWECSKGHKFEMTPNQVNQNHWCPYCAGRGRTIHDMNNIAHERGGKCLSDSFMGMTKKHLWECSKGHQWEAVPDSIRRGSWCPTCMSTKLTIKQMQELAVINGGRCLSTQYVKAQTKLLWQCSEGHQWLASPSHVTKGSWCPRCAGHGKTIDDMHRLAAQYGGKCLSEAYVNASTKLHWQCEKGHIWLAAPKRVLEGRWCHECRKLKRHITRTIQRTRYAHR